MEELLVVSTAANSVELGLHTIAKARAKWKARSQAQHEPHSQSARPPSPPLLAGHVTRSHSLLDMDDDADPEAVPVAANRSFSPTAMVDVATSSVNCVMRARNCYRSCMRNYPCCYRSCVRIPFGVATVLLYYADVLSDLLLAQDLFITGNPIWGSLTITFVALQYVACYVGVLLYMRTVYGADSCAFVLFVLFGFPLAPIVLDILMFFEPLMLIEWLCCSQLKYLLPAYRSTRTLIEVNFEGMPQSILQLYIFARMAGVGPPVTAGLASVSMELLLRSLGLSLLSFTKATTSILPPPMLPV